MNSEFGSEIPEERREGAGTSERLKARAGEAAAKLSDLAGRSAASLAEEAQTSLKSALNEKVASGADMVSQVAAAARAAAAQLDRDVPLAAGLVRSAADRMDTFSQGLKGQSVDELVQSARALARERPAVVFGAAAACGFALYRIITANGPGENRRQAG